MASGDEDADTVVVRTVGDQDGRVGAFGDGFDVGLAQGLGAEAAVTKASGLSPGFQSRYTSSHKYSKYPHPRLSDLPIIYHWLLEIINTPNSKQICLFLLFRKIFLIILLLSFLKNEFFLEILVYFFKSLEIG